jgi:hypothetical protein
MPDVSVIIDQHDGAQSRRKYLLALRSVRRDLERVAAAR